MNNYTPKPIDTSAIELPKEIYEITEILARNVHEVWASRRIKEGWQFGEQRNDAQKLHPFLIDYNNLPESEKEYDRSTAIETLKVILKLGFEIKIRITK